MSVLAVEREMGHVRSFLSDPSSVIHKCALLRDCSVASEPFYGCPICRVVSLFFLLYGRPM